MSRTKYRLTKKGRGIVEQARITKGWTREDVSIRSLISASTLKRFLSGQAISAATFIQICKAVGIDDWQELADFGEMFDSCKNSPQELESKVKYAITLTGIFAEHEKLQVLTIIEALKDLLSSVQIVIKTDEDFE